jgi:hypothetical protein
MIARTQRCIALISVIWTTVCGTAAFGQGLRYWQFDDDFSSGANAEDMLPSPADLIYEGGSSRTNFAVNPIPNPDAGPFEDASNPAVNGTSGRYSVSAPRFWRKTSLFKVLDTASWTFEGWFQRDTVSAVETIASTHNEWTDNPDYAWPEGWWLRMSGDGRLQLRIENGAGDSLFFTTTTEYDDNQWHHFAVVWDHDEGANGAFLLFVDGVLKASGDGLGGFSPAGESVYFTVGYHYRENQNPQILYTFGGLLDEFRWTARALARNEFLNAVKRGTVLLIR